MTIERHIIEIVNVSGHTVDKRRIAGGASDAIREKARFAAPWRSEDTSNPLHGRLGAAGDHYTNAIDETATDDGASLRRQIPPMQFCDCSPEMGCQRRLLTVSIGASHRMASEGTGHAEHVLTDVSQD
jgi:hypothetical protein